MYTVVMSSMYQSITYSLKSKFRTFEFNGERYHNKRSSLAFDVGSFIVEVCDSVETCVGIVNPVLWGANLCQDRKSWEGRNPQRRTAGQPRSTGQVEMNEVAT